MPHVRFHAFGFPVLVAPSFLLVGGVVLVFGLRFGEPLWSIALTTAVIFLSTLVHELGHALASRWFRVPVAFIHIHGLGGVVHHGRASTGQRLAIALAGPGAGFLLALAAAGLLPLANNPYAAHGLGVALVLNLLWSIFNLLPIIPMDGGNALHAALSMVVELRTATLATLTVGALTGLTLALGALWGGFGLLALVGGFFVFRNVELIRKVL